ncbi:hypothetical protein G9P44_000555 [Scheffersomyces stipitis]|nr:hypothetical protein G9P44_000555 [Scheffersomyces stipitis]
MMSAGFQWGSKATLPEQVTSRIANEISEPPASVPRYTPKVENPHNNKKRVHEEENSTPAPYKPNSHRKFRSINHGSNSSKFKKSKTPKILGQTLPISRLIEVLDHKPLQNLLLDLVNMHPEIGNTINKLSPKPTVHNSINLLKEKFDDILSHLPYKCDVESDYSYLRVKPYLTEFLNCLSDFILNFLPPIEVNIVHSLTFLDLITFMIHELPNFTNSEFQYTRMMAYEQIGNTWLIVLSQKIQGDIEGETSSTQSPPEDSATENSIKLVKVVQHLGLVEKLSKHNELGHGKFKLALDLIKSEIDQVEMFNHALSGAQNGANSGGVLGDLITVDYSNFSITARTSH